MVNSLWSRLTHREYPMTNEFKRDIGKERLCQAPWTKPINTSVRSRTHGSSPISTPFHRALSIDSILPELICQWEIPYPRGSSGMASPELSLGQGILMSQLISVTPWVLDADILIL